MQPIKLTSAQVKKAVKQKLEKELADQKLYKRLCDFLSQYEGKKITKRIEHKEEFNKTFKLTHSRYSLRDYEITVRRDSDCLDIQKEYFRCSTDSDNFSLEKFHQDNTPYSSGTPDRILKLRAVLQNPESMKLYSTLSKKLLDLVQFTQELDNGSNSGSYKNPAHWELLKAMNVSSDLMSEIRFFKGSK